MNSIDLEHDPTQYVAQNLISEIGENSDLTYHEQSFDENFVTGPSSLEEQNGEIVMATMEGYERTSQIDIEELPYESVEVTVKVFDSPAKSHDERKAYIGVELPSEHRQGDSQKARQAFYDQIREDLDFESADRARESEMDDSLILEYSWE